MASTFASCTMAENCHEKRHLAPMHHSPGFYILTPLHLQRVDER